MAFPIYKQMDSKDCGPTCIRIIAKFYGKHFSLQSIREKCSIDKEGVSLQGISDGAENIGFRTLAVRISLSDLCERKILPCIIHWQQNHFIVVYKIQKKSIWVSDPARGIVKYNKQDFLNGWINDETKDSAARGIAMVLEPTTEFYNKNGDKPARLDLKYLLSHFIKFRKSFTKVSLCLLAGSLLQLLLPFLTQSIVDKGISGKDVHIIHLALLGQLILFLGSITFEFTRNWILLHVTAELNISMVAHFLTKLTRLSLPFFESRTVGDILQRISDHRRIESFMTGQSLSLVFSLFTFIIYTCIMVFYDLKIFAIFMLGSLVYFGWVLLFIKKRKELDYMRFDISTINQNSTIQFIGGMQEIKLNGCEKKKLWEWENIQRNLFVLNINSLKLNQIQQGGSGIINQLKNITITLFVALSVIEGKLTLGGMMAIQYIIGQLNVPVQQLITYIQALQDAKLSLERISEVNQIKDEEPDGQDFVSLLPQNRSIILKNLNFRYPGHSGKNTLQDINIHIPEGKTTAIVGTSGSGKTTLLKILLKLYEPTDGDIFVGETPLSSISNKYWRSQCGTVMQDGFIFSDTIANNITINGDAGDEGALTHAAKIANLTDFIESLPLKISTQIGSDGVGISQGQRQRVLIARAIYKNPHYIFLDEATNSLDTTNESLILNGLEGFFRGKTVIIVAHRLSTVQNADQIVVLKNGTVTECGNHKELIALQGDYFSLIRNQLGNNQINLYGIDSDELNI